MKQLAEKVSQNKNFDVELIDLVLKLYNQLVESKGKKVYGYLKSDVKKTVDEIFARLADNESVKKCTIYGVKWSSRSMMCTLLQRSGFHRSLTTKNLNPLKI